MKPIQYQVNIRISAELARQLENLAAEERRRPGAVAADLFQLGLMQRTRDMEATTARVPNDTKSA